MRYVTIGVAVVVVLLLLAGTMSGGKKTQLTPYATIEGVSGMDGLLGVWPRGFAKGDINGDGFPDVIAFSFTVAGQALRIFQSDITGQLPSTPQVTIVDPNPDVNDQWGYDWAVGDINADGYDDIVVGRRIANYIAGTDTVLKAGGAYVYLGGATVGPGPDVTIDPPEPQANTYFGMTVEVGDYNNDGYDDFIIYCGAYRWIITDPADRPDTVHTLPDTMNLDYGNIGKGWFFKGGPTVPTTPDFVMWRGQWHAAQSGWLGGQTADYNGDGIDDFAVSSYGAGINTNILGQHSWLQAHGPQPARTLWDSLMANTTTAADSAVLWEWYRTRQGEARIYFGGSDISYWADTSDVILRKQNDRAEWGGYVDLFGYGWGRLPLGDVNGDGYDDIYVSGFWAARYYPPGSEKFGYQSGDHLGHLFLGGPNMGANIRDWNHPAEFHFGSDKSIGRFREAYGIGDVNGDGYNDFLLEARRDSVGVINSTRIDGRAYVYLGASTLDTAPDLTIEIDDPSPDWGGGGFPSRAMELWDMNGDGITEFMVSAPRWGAEVTVGDWKRRPGKLYIYAGDATWTNVKGKVPATPVSFSLSQNYPNPFNMETRIAFALPKSSKVTLKVYNILGQEIRTLLEKRMEAGTHKVSWNGRDSAGRIVASGLYVYRLKAGDHVATKKMVVLK